MPPRKRAAAAPKTTEAPGADTAPPEPAPPAAGDETETAQPPATNGPGTADADLPPEETTAAEPPAPPARSDLKDVEQPCAECFPNGWPEQAFSVGCTHGTWIRETEN